ncbi:MAG: hypothetical protein JSS24_05360, partial [Proteobacteria bacterium]|nr:hypothetical protein [Pseudomonadota bacterium]
IKLMSWDGAHGAALGPFSIVVKAATSTPLKISGTPPASVAVGGYYSFRPTVSAASGAQLTFSVSNLPRWASFSKNSGWLFGTPTSNNVATYSNIVIQVSDSKTNASTPAFKIAVTKQANDTGNGSALLSWVKPSKNTDGSPLVNLSGYRIHYGTSPSSLSKLVTVGSPSSTSASIEGLSSGTWYFAVVAFTTAGIESAMSSSASKTIK